MNFLKGYQGYLQADAYTGYDKLFDHKQTDYQIIEVACMAHVRRKFYEIAQQAKKPGTAHQALSFIQKLYRAEKAARELSDDDRKQLRQEQAKPILVDFKQWLDQTVNRVLPKSPLGTAVSYALKNWDALTRYLKRLPTQLNSKLDELLPWHWKSTQTSPASNN